MENLEDRPFLRKSGIAWNSQEIFYDIYPSQGRSGKTYLLDHVSFSVTLSWLFEKYLFGKWLFGKWLFGKWSFHLFSVNEFYLFAYCYSKYVHITYLLGSVFFAYFCKM